MHIDAPQSATRRPLRVALFSRFPTDPARPRGGVESVTVVLVRALARLDDLKLHVVTLEQDRSTVEIQSVDGAQVHRVPGSKWPQMLDILMGPGRRRLVRYLLELQPDVVHTHETYGLMLSNLPVPHVFTVHGFDHANLIADSARFASLRSPIWRQIERCGLGRQRHIISISPYVRQMLEPLTRAVIHQIDNPVDERFFDVPRRPEAGRVLCVGWINHRKNTLGAVQALAQVVKQGIDARIAIAGEPKENEYYRQVTRFIEQSGLEERVEFLGHVNHDRLQRELGRAAVFLLPSRQENSPMAIAEAMAVGVPVVAADRCGMPYMVVEGESGFLIDPENTGQIADRLVRLLRDADRGEQMGRRAREIAKVRFHPDAVATRTRAVYRQLCQPALQTATVAAGAEWSVS